MTTRKIIGLARIIDRNDDGTCRVRLFDEDRLPKGAVLAGVTFRPEIPPVAITTPLPELTDEEFDTIARQNVLYNSYEPVIIE